MANGAFPKPVKLGAKAVAWRLSDILDWIDSLSVGGGDA
jgi:predicted DNA-binding transcriptional regulator AlpA